MIIIIIIIIIITIITIIIIKIITIIIVITTIIIINKECTIPIGSLVVPFWDYLNRILNMNHKTELLRSLWVISIVYGP